jgi:MFS family permease
VAKQKSSQGDGSGSPSSSSSAGPAADESPSLWAFILGTFVHQIADNANKLVVPLVYLQLTSVGIMSILTGVMTLLQTFGTLPAGRWASAIGPKALIQWITVGRALLTTILAVVFLFYSNGALGSGLTLFLVTLITSADWFIRGTE